MSGLRLLVLLVVCWQGLAQDTGLPALRSSLKGMRGKPLGPDRLRGATPALTLAKHQLRDWVESRLPALAPRGDEREFQRMLNSELREAGLLCCGAPAADGETGPDFTYSGFIGELELRQDAGFLILQTAFGIECGYDESAYLYSWSAEGWRRAWQTEQNVYTEKGYEPQTIHAVLFSPFSRANDYLVLTLGWATWCSSNWHPVYYRAFRLGPSLDAPPLLDGEEFAYFANDPPIQGSVARDDVLVEFTVGSIDAGVHSRPAVRHYRIDGDRVTRVDPLALSPRGFVDEWLTHDWKEAASW